MIYFISWNYILIKGHMNKKICKLIEKWAKYTNMQFTVIKQPTNIGKTSLTHNKIKPRRR